MKTASSAKTEFLHQERVDRAVKTAMPIDSDAIEFLKSHDPEMKAILMRFAANRRTLQTLCLSLQIRFILKLFCNQGKNRNGKSSRESTIL